MLHSGSKAELSASSFTTFNFELKGDIDNLILQVECYVSSMTYFPKGSERTVKHSNIENHCCSQHLQNGSFKYSNIVYI